jgi:hypothetical protein
LAVSAAQRPAVGQKVLLSAFRAKLGRALDLAAPKKFRRLEFLRLRPRNPSERDSQKKQASGARHAENKIFCATVSASP